MALHLCHTCLSTHVCVLNSMTSPVVLQSVAVELLHYSPVNCWKMWTKGVVARLC